MVEYNVLFAVKMNAKNKEELYVLAENTGEKLSKCLKKTVAPYSYAELVKKDVPRKEVKLC